MKIIFRSSSDLIGCNVIRLIFLLSKFFPKILAKSTFELVTTDPSCLNQPLVISFFFSPSTPFCCPIVGSTDRFPIGLVFPLVAT